jgi:predicted PilT family ATPase
MGGVVSETLTAKIVVPTRPPFSVAMHVTVVAPIGKVDAEGGTHVIGTGPS